MVQARSDELNREELEFILFLCAVYFPNSSPNALVWAKKIVDDCIEALVDTSWAWSLPFRRKKQTTCANRIAMEKASNIMPNLVVANVSPCDARGDIQQATELLRGQNVDFAVFHCMGFLG